MKKMKLTALALAVALGLAACGAKPAEKGLMGGGAASSAADVQTSGAASAADSASVPESPIPLGEITAESLTGDTIDQTVFAGHKLTVINVWATFCGPCKQEMPVLGKLAEELKDDVQVLGIVTDVVDQSGNPDEVQVQLAKDLVAASDVGYQNLILNESLAQLGFASLQAVPATLFVDGDGNLVGKGFYGALEEDDWRQVIDERLALAEEAA